MDDIEEVPQTRKRRQSSEFDPFEDYRDGAKLHERSCSKCGGMKKVEPRSDSAGETRYYCEGCGADLGDGSIGGLSDSPCPDE